MAYARQGFSRSGDRIWVGSCPTAFRPEGPITGQSRGAHCFPKSAVAYTRSLEELSSELELRLFEQVTALAVKRLAFVVHLGLSPFFEQRGAAPHRALGFDIPWATPMPSMMNTARPQRLDLRRVKRRQQSPTPCAPYNGN